MVNDVSLVIIAGTIIYTIFFIGYELFSVKKKCIDIELIGSWIGIIGGILCFIFWVIIHYGLPFYRTPILNLILVCSILGMVGGAFQLAIYYLKMYYPRYKEKSLFPQLNNQLDRLFRRGWYGIILGIGFMVFWSFIYYGFPNYRNDATTKFLNCLLVLAISSILIGAVDLYIYYRQGKSGSMKNSNKRSGIQKEH